MHDLNAADLIDTDRYPLHDLESASGEALVNACRQQLEALCALPGFIRPDALTQMVAESAPLAAASHYYDEPRGSFGYDPKTLTQWPAGHPCGVRHTNRYRQVLNHQVRNDSALRQLYLWPQLTEFVRQVFGAKSMHRSQCPHLSLSLKIAGEGDTDGWHYDPNDGVVSLLLQTPDSGGQFEYAPYIRSETDPRYDAVAALFADPEGSAQRPAMQAGTFVFFNGHLSMHRVSPVGQTAQPRIAALLSFDQSSNQVFSQRYIDHVRSFPRDVDQP